MVKFFNPSFNQTSYYARLSVHVALATAVGVASGAAAGALERYLEADKYVGFEQISVSDFVTAISTLAAYALLRKAFKCACPVNPIKYQSSKNYFSIDEEEDPNESTRLLLNA